MRLAEFGRTKQRHLIGALVMFLLVAMCVPFAVSQEGNGVLRSRSYKLKYITSSQAQEMLSELKIGNDYDPLTDQVLIVTSTSSLDLNKVTEVLTILDREQPGSIRVLGTQGPQQPLPSPDALMDQLKNVTAGTMADAPPRGTINPAIIDKVGESLIAIGDETVMADIQTAFDAWIAANPPRPIEPVIEPTPETAAKVEPVEPATEVVTDDKATGDSAEPVVTEEAPVEESVVEEPAVEEKMVLGASDMESPTTLAQLAEKLMGAEKETAPETDEPVVVEPVEEIQVVEPVKVVEEKPVVPEVMTETQDVAVEDVPVEKVVEEPVDDIFMDEGLLDTLEKEVAAKEAKLAAEKAALEAAAEEVVEAEPTQTATPAEPVVTETPQPMSNAARERAEAIARMQAQAEAERKAAQTAQAGADDELKKALQALLGGGAPKPVQETVKTPVKSIEPVEATDTGKSALEQEIAMLKAQIAELKAAKSQAEPETEMPAKKGSAVPETATEEKEPESKPLTTFEEAIGEEMLDTVIDLPQEVELEALVDLVGKQLGLNYMYDPAILKNQKVTLKIHKGQIKVRDLYALLESVLRFRGFVMTRRDNLVTIMRTVDMAKFNPDPVFRNPDDPIDPGQIIVSTVYDLENIASTEAKKVLDGMKLSSIANGIEVVPGTNRLIVTDYAYRMDHISKALAMIDVAGEPKEFEYRQLQYMQAADLMDKLKTLIGEMEGVSLQVSSTPTKPVATRTIRTRDPATGRTITKEVPVTTSTPAAAAASSAAKEGAVFIDVDERTNRLLMIGKRSELDTLNQLIDTLDVPQHDLKSVREYVIQHVEAIEVVNVLNELGLATVSVSTTSTTGTSSAARTPVTSRTPTPTPAPRPTPTPTTKSSGTQPNISIRPATNSLLVNATAEQHAAIELVIAHVDVVQKDQRTIREYEIQFVDTQEIIDTMTDLGMISSQSAGSSSTSRSSTSRSTTSRSTPSRSTPPTAGAEAVPTMDLAGLTGEEGSSITEQEPQISILEATNSLLVYATPRQHQAIALLIAHADRVPETTTTPYVVYALENQTPSTLAETLDKIVLARQGDATQKTSAAAKVQPGTPSASSSAATPNLPSLEEESIRIIPDEESYSLIVYANKRNQQWIGELIKELDEYRPQVLLDCTLVEVTKDDQFKFEMDLVSKTYSDLTLRPGTSGSIGGSGTSIGNLGGSSSFDPLRYAHAATSAGTFTGFFNSDMIQGLLTAMQENGYGRVMARPKILVNDNQEGEIKTETVKPVAQAKTNVIPGTATQTSTSTTDVTFNDYTAGVTLNITPHISKGDMLRLEVTLNRTDFAENDPVEIKETDNSLTPTTVTKTYPSPPDRISTDLTTVSTVPDGTTIILGGLETINQGKSIKKVPFLGDLPLVGGLFRDVSDTDSEGKLYVFVKANIIRPGDQVGGIEDIKRVSGKYRAQFEEMEDKFQTMQDWPGIDSKPMTPQKVLEEDFEEDEAPVEASESM